MKKTILTIIAILLLGCIAAGVGVMVWNSNHSFQLTADVEGNTTGEVRAVVGVVKVQGTQDTSVTFKDVETGEEVVVGYITPGMTEKVKLEKNHWYTVEAFGTITLSPVEVRVS